MTRPEDQDPDTPHGEGRDPLRYATGYHAPVLCNAVVEGLITRPGGTYVDGTLGGGGHTAALLAQLAPEGQVIGIDQDPDARAAAAARLPDDLEQGRLVIVAGNFEDVEGLLGQAGEPMVDGLLLDLGVSSHQLDTAARGFSFRGDADLDMRMDPTRGLTAADVVNTWTAGEIARVLRHYGEEPQARRIAQAIVDAQPVETTGALADAVRRVVPTRYEAKVLARVFQALRIVVNDELGALERALDAATRILRPGGRCAIISYHSLEDRRVKRFFRYGNLEGKPVRDVYGNRITPWREVTRRPIAADAAEVAANPRARSARLRIAERLPDDP